MQSTNTNSMRSRLSQLSMKKVFAVVLLFTLTVGGTVFSIYLPRHFDSQLGQHFSEELLPNLRSGMEGIGQEAERRLEAKEADTLARAEAAFERENNAIANGLVANLLPMVENFDLEGMENEINKRLETTPELLGVRVRTQKKDPWTDYGTPDKAESRTFSAQGKSEYGFVELQMSFTTNELKRVLQSERESFAKLMEHIRSATKDTIDETHGKTVDIQEHLSRNLSWLLILAAVVSSIVLMAIVMLILDLIVIRPIRNAVSLLDRVAAGDLSVEIQASGKDEVSQLLSAMQRMTGKLREHLGMITTSTKELDMAADQMSAITAETNQGVLQQHSETDQVATAINEMSATVQEVARNTIEAAGASKDAELQSRDGQQIVADSRKSFEELSNEVQTATEVIKKLYGDAESIGSVLDVIKGIAEQTNLLALNAAIEAARAGELGRGFAVVADEVRTLASRTQQSTLEIQQMIERLQEGAKSAVKVMDEGSAQAQKSVQQASGAEVALETITAAVARINEMNTHIATASEQQSAVAEDINRSIVNISQIGTRTAEGAEQTKAAGENLTRLTEHLRTLVAQYRL